MVNVTTRTGKGSRLTTLEVDANFTDLAAALNFLLPSAVAFSAGVPFTGNARMPPQTVSAAIAFSANTTGAVDGAQASVHLIADGVNAPTFGAEFREWGGSSGYDNRANIRNVINFWREGGVYWYSIGQAANATAEAVPATAVQLTGPATSVVSAASTNFTASTNGVITDPIVVTPSDGGAGGTFTPTSVTLVAGTNTSATFTYTASATGAKTISVTNNGGLSNPSALSLNVIAAPTAPSVPTGLAAGTATSSAVPLSWSAPASNGGAAITDYVVQYKASASGTWLTFADGTSTTTSATVTGLTAATAYDFRVAAVNSVGAGPYTSAVSATTASSSSSLRITSLSGLSESGTGPYTYTRSSSGFGGKGVANLSFQSGVDGYVEFTLPNIQGSGPAAIIGLDALAGAASGGYAQIDYAFYMFNAGVGDAGLYTMANGSQAGPFGSGFTPLDGDTFRITRTGSSLKISYSRSGSGFADLYTWPSAVSTGQLYVGCDLSGSGTQVSNLLASGLA